MRSGQLAAAAGVSVETLRHYERRGLLPEPRRTLGRHRDYGTDALTLVRVVKVLQRLGFTLEEVEDLLAVGAHRRPRPGLRERARDKLADVDARIAALTTMRAALLDVIDAGCADLTECACTPDCPIPFSRLAPPASRLPTAPPCRGDAQDREPDDQDDRRAVPGTASAARLATPEDIDAIQSVERAAGEMFRQLGMDTVADDEPLSPATLREFIDGRRAWVVERDNEIAGYVLVDVVDGCGHIEQVSVDSRHAHQRIGAYLIEHVAEWAANRELGCLTLTTFRGVPWNGPYYLQRGFRWLTRNEVTPGLRALREKEAQRGLDRWPRGNMRRDLPGCR